MEWKIFRKLWLQKILRNVASVKYQWLLFLYIPIIYGMFDGKWINETMWVAKIPPTLGLGFLGGGFMTLAMSRMYVKTKLTEDDNDLNTDK